MIVEYDHGDRIERVIVDFVVPTVAEALELIADGAINGVDLLEQAGLTHEEAEAELARLAEGTIEGTN